MTNFASISRLLSHPFETLVELLKLKAKNGEIEGINEGKQFAQT